MDYLLLYNFKAQTSKLKCSWYVSKCENMSQKEQILFLVVSFFSPWDQE
jgi:hypothetical protein